MKTLAAAAIRCSLIFLLPTVAYSISAQWDLDPISGDWNTAANWTPMGVPNDPADTATFGFSHATDVSISADTEVNGIIFTAAANPYTISSSFNLTLTISGAGIINNSGVTQHFVTSGGSFPSGGISFANHATAGSSSIFTNDHGVGNFAGGHTLFFDSSTAGNATFVNNTGESGTFQGFTDFFNTSTAANGTFVNEGSTTQNLGNGGGTTFADSSSAGEAMITNDGGTVNNAGGGTTAFAGHSTAAFATVTNNSGMVSGALGGFLDFFDNATAANGIFMNNGGTVSGAGGARMLFTANSTAGNSTLIANGGMNGGLGATIHFAESSTGSTARVEVFGNGSLDISDHFLTARGLTVGSIEGDGSVFLGANNFRIGSNDLSTTFSGVIHDGGGFSSTGGSITKIGTGALTLTGQNTYTGSTTVNQGTLIVNGSITSATTVHGGTIGGSGAVRDVTVNSGGTLAPGNSTGILTVQGNLVLNLGANYLVDLNGTVVGSQYDQTNVSGTVTVAGATLALSLGFTPPTGTVFLIIRNGSNNPVNGTFADLPEGAVFTADGQAFMISYQAGDGNDVALTSVVPEPTSWTLVTIGAIMVVTWHRRRAACTSNHFWLARESRVMNDQRKSVSAFV